jgi:hypothetical protein
MLGLLYETLILLNSFVYGIIITLR